MRYRQGGVVTQFTAFSNFGQYVFEGTSENTKKGVFRFTESEQLIGLHGTESDSNGMILSVGAIKYQTTCDPLNGATPKFL